MDLCMSSSLGEYLHARLRSNIGIGMWFVGQKSEVTMKKCTGHVAFVVVIIIVINGRLLVHDVFRDVSQNAFAELSQDDRRYLHHVPEKHESSDELIAIELIVLCFLERSYR